MSLDIREKVTGWFTSPETTYLIGAGCSACAGKPLIMGLTNKIHEKMCDSMKGRFSAMKGMNRPATIEDFINHLIKYREVLSGLQNTDGHDLTIADIDQNLEEIKKNIVTEIADIWIPSETHKRFLRRISNPRSERPRDLFSLNYDTVIEASLDDLRIPYADGFRGSRNAWFSPDVFDEALNTKGSFRLYKLHGSVNWARNATDNGVRRIVLDSGDAARDPVVVYPSEQKYLVTRYGIYETLLSCFRNKLRSQTSNNCLVVLGYSFNDEHINEAIIDAVSSPNNNLTVMTFIGAEEDKDAQKARLEAIVKRCDHRFNAFVGKDFMVGTALGEEEIDHVLNLELWKFENLVTFIAGGTA